MTPAICKECGGPESNEAGYCPRCRKPSLIKWAYAGFCRNYALGSALLFAFALVATKERTWIDNLPIVIGLSTAIVLIRLIVGFFEPSAADRNLVQVSRWKHVLAGLAVVGLIDWLTRTEFIWAAIGFALIGGALFLIFRVIRSSYKPSMSLLKPSPGNLAPRTKSSKNATVPSDQPSPSGSAAGEKWFWKIAVGVFLAWFLNGQFQKPANKVGNAQHRQLAPVNAQVANAQIADATEQFWNQQVVRLVQLEQAIPEPEVNQSFGEFLQLTETILTQGTDALPSSNGDRVVVDCVNLFNRHRNDLMELRATVVAIRMKSTAVELDRQAIDFAEIGNAALAANEIPNDAAISKLLALALRLEKHEVEWAILKGKLSERFPNRNFTLPE